ncbi:MAG: MBL fold metallo-hydrolase [Candidatus Bathyarchaeia archaeon]
MNKTDSRAVELRQVDSAEIVSLMDNSVDFLTATSKEEVRSVREWIKEQKTEKWIRKRFRLPIAEHGFSMLIRVFVGQEKHSVLFDAGISKDGVATNTKRMGLDLGEVECIVLSHGHYDHFGGLLHLLKTLNRDKLPIIVHKDMFRPRGVANADGTIRKYPAFPSEKKVKPAKYVKTTQPSKIADGTILVTGEVPRKTEFEKGFMQQRALVKGKWQPDPWVWDDRALVLNVKHKGLIVLSGCAHAGIINTVLYAKELTKTDAVYAIMGGFHLAGKDHEHAIGKTVEKLKELQPTLIAPSHCTGWKGAFAIAKALPKAFVWNSVGNLYRFGSFKRV